MAELTDDEKRQIWLRVLGEMKHHTKPAMAAVYGVEREDHGLLVGSGIFVRILGATHLLTASHVLETASRFEFLAHSNDYGTKPVPIRFPFRLQPYPLDLGFTLIDEAAVAPGAIVPWPVEALADNADHLEGDILFIHGYPGERSTWLPIVNGGVKAESLPLGTVVRNGETGWADFNPILHFAVEYWPEGWFDERGRTLARPNPHCLSGSAVWRANIRGRSHTEWKATDARIVGVLHRYNPEHDSLIATRTEHVRDFVLRMIRREYAYHKWQERGEPLGDELRDWYAAVGSIPLLSSHPL